MNVLLVLRAGTRPQCTMPLSCASSRYSMSISSSVSMCSLTKLMGTASIDLMPRPPSILKIGVQGGQAGGRSGIDIARAWGPCALGACSSGAGQPLTHSLSLSQPHTLEQQQGRLATPVA